MFTIIGLIARIVTGLIVGIIITNEMDNSWKRITIILIFILSKLLVLDLHFITLKL